VTQNTAMSYSIYSFKKKKTIIILVSIKIITICWLSKQKQNIIQVCYFNTWLLTILWNVKRIIIVYWSRKKHFDNNGLFNSVTFRRKKTVNQFKMFWSYVYVHIVYHVGSSSLNTFVILTIIKCNQVNW